MSWNLIIYKTGNTSQQVEPLGNLNRVTDALNAAFIDLEWESPIAAALPVEGGFRVNLAVRDRTVQEVYVDGGFNHIRQFAGLCKREGWRMSDVQEGMDVHLDDPQRRYKERSALPTEARRSTTKAATPVSISGSSAGRSRRYALWFLAAAITVYVALYFVCSDIYRGQVAGERVTFRIFQHRSALLVWAPLLKTEQLLRQEKFQGHVASGGSLPPPAPN
jgi:hypothetical protein